MASCRRTASCCRWTSPCASTQSTIPTPSRSCPLASCCAINCCPDHAHGYEDNRTTPNPEFCIRIHPDLHADSCPGPDDRHRRLLDLTLDRISNGPSDLFL